MTQRHFRCLTTSKTYYATNVNITTIDIFNKRKNNFSFLHGYDNKIKKINLALSYLQIKKKLLGRYNFFSDLLFLGDSRADMWLCNPWPPRQPASADLICEDPTGCDFRSIIYFTNFCSSFEAIGRSILYNYIYGNKVLNRYNEMKQVVSLKCLTLRPEADAESTRKYNNIGTNFCYCVNLGCRYVLKW